MKYKKQIATGALAISLFMGGNPAYASVPNRKYVQNITLAKNFSTVGFVSSVTGSGFILNIRNKKNNGTTTIDVLVPTNIIVKKDGATALYSDLTTGQKAVVTGSFDKSTKVLTAKSVKIVTLSHLKKGGRG